LESQQVKKIFFLMALPRSGNTLFGSIMNQNPDIGATANSITLEIMKVLILLKTETDTFKNFPDHKSLDNVLSSVYKNYYKDWNYKYIIDRGPVLTPANFELMKQYFDQPIKCIIIWRNLLDVFASYIKWFENEPTAYPNQFGKTIEEKLFRLMDINGGIAKELMAIQNALRPENRHMCHFLKYDELVNDTKNQINKIYDFLEIPRFNHNFKTLNQFKVNGISYDDSIVGNKMHTIREEIRKEENPYYEMIPKSIIREYGHIVL